MVSGSASPFAPKQIATRKQRSSSVNSVGSNVSNQRSMSIVSLELPRNSIVSVEDALLRRVCNSSTTSLTSLAPVTSPTDPKEYYTLSNRMHKSRAKASSAVFSDEDSESELTVSRFRWRRRSSDKGLSGFLPNLKRDFKFRYGGAFGIPKTLAPKTPEDVAPSPLSSSADLHHHNQHQPLHLHLHHAYLPQSSSSSSPPPPPPSDCHIASPHSFHVSLSAPNLGSSSYPPTLNASTSSTSTKSEADIRSSAVGKKFRTSSASQSILLKKRLLLSKDIQHELSSTLGSPLFSPSSLLGTETRFPSGPLSTSIAHPSHHISRSDSSSTVVIPISLENGKQSPLLLPTEEKSSLNPEGASVKNQNKLIYELNRKWNKTFFDVKSPEKKTPSSGIENPSVPSRKRNRSVLTSSVESSRLV